MSKIVDERVVSMNFDNKQFEKNVSTTLSTLDKLKQSLKLEGVSKGLENINSSAKKVDMSAISNGIETIHAKFSALEIVAITALANITNSVMNTGKRMLSALTIDPVKTGLQEYETKINSIQTIMSNTASKGTTMEDVTEVINELNTYADKTIYNFAEMTRNIGTFTAAGVGLRESASAIQGIANLAAASGSSSQQASTAMYQLSQALATGTVKLMDWNSVVNAGMGGEKFQEALKATAREHGVAVDEIINKNGSFRDSLQEGWLSADILNTTLNKFTVDGAANYAKSMMESGKWTKEQADALMKEAQAMEDAATKVKTYTQLWDTLKEAAQSGWAQTWEIIIGDFEEAKALFSSISDVIGGMIGSSADARNEMLQGWKDLGGRTALIESFKNIFEQFGNVIKPITQAFREIFPPTTSEQLYKLTEGFKSFTENLKISDETVKNIKSTFKGLFAVLDIVVEVIKSIASVGISLITNLLGIKTGFLNLTGSIGDSLTKFRDFIKESNFLGSAVKKTSDFISSMTSRLNEFRKSLIDSFSSNNYKGFSGFLNGIWGVITNIGSKIGDVFSYIANDLDFSNIFSAINGGLLAGILLTVKKFISGLSGSLDGANDALKNITGILDDVRGCFKAYQDQLKAGTLLKISSAIAILAASILVISSINEEDLSKSLGAITVLFAELLGSLAIFTKINTNIKGVFKASTAMISMSTSILILASALKKIASIKTENITKALVAIGILMAELSVFLNTAKIDGKILRTASGIIILSASMVILSKAVKNFGVLDWSSITKGLVAIGILLSEITLFSNLTGNAKHILTTGASMLLLAASIKIFASSIKDISGISWEDIAKGLLAIGGSLAIVTASMHLMPKNTISISVGLIAFGAAMKILASSLLDFSGLSWDDLTRGLVAMGLSLAELAIGLNLMNGTLAGSAALLIASTSLLMIGTVVKKLSNLSWEGIVKSLVSIAGTLAIVGVAGTMLTPLIPTLLGLSAAFALFGVATLGIGTGLIIIGAGLTSISAGFTALVAACSTGTTIFVASLSVIVTETAKLIPTLVKYLGEGIVEFSKVIGEHAPELANSIVLLFTSVLESLANNVPKIVDLILKFLIGILESVANNLPQLITAAMKVIMAFFQGIVDALSTVDTEILMKGLIGVGLLAGLMAALGAVASLVPAAMIGVLGMGVILAELVVVLAAIGALAQLPGLNYLIKEGGNLLQNLGTSIGQFVGGIVGGFASGISSSFPKIGSDLSEFMKNIEPFIEGASQLDESSMKGVKALAETILLLTATEILDGLTAWFTGGNSLAEFAEQLVPFGKSIKQYADSIKGIDNKGIKASASAAKTLAEFADNLPNSGGLLGWFVGENDLADFAEQLVPFGKNIKKYSESIKGIDTKAVTASASAAKSLSELANNLPNSGGLASWFAGDNNISDFGEQLVPFGNSMKEFSNSVKGIDSKAVESSATAAKAFGELAKNLPEGDAGNKIVSSGLSNLGTQLVPFGKSMTEYSKAIQGIDAEAVSASATAAKAFAELANNLPSSGGIISWLAGEKDMSLFGEQLVPFGNSMKAFSNAVTGIDAQAITASATAGKTLSELAKNLPMDTSIFSMFFSRQELTNFGEQIIPFGKSMKSYSDAVTGINSEAVIASANAGKTLSELALNLPKSGSITSFINGDIDLTTFAQQIIPFGKSIKAYSDSIIGLNSEAVIASANAGKSLSELVNSLPSNGGIVSLLQGGLSLASFARQLPDLGIGIKSYSDSVLGIDAESINRSITSAKNIVDLVISMKDIDVSGISSFETAISSLNQMTLDGFIKGFSNVSDKVSKIGSDIVKSISDGANSEKKTLNDTMSTIITKMLDVCKKDKSSFKSEGTNLISSLCSGIEDGSDKAKKVIISTLSNIVSAIKDYNNNFYNAGEYLVKGFADGISNNTWRAAAQSKAMALAAANAAKKALDEHSPSKVGYEIGDYFGVAFVDAISHYKTKAQKAGSSIATAARNGLSGAIGRLADLVDSNIDASPTIRPILDLSDINDDVNSISGMFEMTPSLSMISRVEAVSSMMNNNQNGKNDDIISAIKDLNKSINQSSGDTYSINGITYDDESTVTDALKTIVRAAKRERRS